VIERQQQRCPLQRQSTGAATGTLACCRVHNVSQGAQPHLQVGRDLLRLIARERVHDSRGAVWLLPTCDSTDTEMDASSCAETLLSQFQCVSLQDAVRKLNIQEMRAVNCDMQCNG
jgi:hypothetical protein